MYKVFINDRPIILTDAPQNIPGFDVYNFEHAVIDELVHRLKKSKSKGIILFCKELTKNWTHFLSYFKVIEAAGGLVLNDKKDILFIYRGSKWDLPKGRIEEGESIETTAVREVEEECGISDLNLGEFLTTTYHVFFQSNEKRLKVTHWYLMTTDYKGDLTPQLEEGITKVEFKSNSETEKALQNSYANIQLVIDQYLGKEPSYS